MKPPTDIAGEIAVQLLECEYCRELLDPCTTSQARLRELKQAIDLARRAIFTVPTSIGGMGGDRG